MFTFDKFLKRLNNSPEPIRYANAVFKDFGFPDHEFVQISEILHKRMNENKSFESMSEGAKMETDNPPKDYAE